MTRRRKRFKLVPGRALAAGVSIACALGMHAGAQTRRPAPAQAPAPPAAHQLPRADNGKPDFSGVWQAINTAAWDIQDHSASLGIPPGTGVVEGNELPYKPEALDQRKKNFDNRDKDDVSQVNCWLPGVPRATYMP